MTETQYCLFDTALGRCGLAWGPGGVLAVSFPEADDAKTRARLLKRAPGATEADAPPAKIRLLIDDIAALLAGEDRDLAYADLDMTGVPEFEREVYGLAIDIKPGETRTYGDLARALGDAAESRRARAPTRANRNLTAVAVGAPTRANRNLTAVAVGAPTRANRNLTAVAVGAPTRAKRNSIAVAVGQALSRNPFPIIVPCHRVIGADGKLVGFSAPGGVEAKRRLLKIEGALAPDLFDAL